MAPPGSSSSGEAPWGAPRPRGGLFDAGEADARVETSFKGIGHRVLEILALVSEHNFRHVCSLSQPFLIVS